MQSDPLVDEHSLVLARACIELARAELQQQEDDTPARRAAVARCRAERDALRHSYAGPRHSRRRSDPSGTPVSPADRPPLL
jgi:hypothetical protein